MPAADKIILRGVSVHNLKSVDLDLPHRKLIVFCGLSGSGKSSLALDTLYAEGQRRYIESFSAYTRQFLQRLEKPDAERIDGIPPAIAVTGKNANRSSRSTVGTATETNDYLRLLFAKIGQVFCLRCGREVRQDTPQSVAEQLARLPADTRFMVAFRLEPPPEKNLDEVAAALREEGFIRVITGGGIVNLAETPLPAPLDPHPLPIYVVIDRLAVGSSSDTRLRDSLETAFAKGAGRCFAFVEEQNSIVTDDVPSNSQYRRHKTDDQKHLPGYYRRGFSAQLTCEDCGLEYPPPEPRLFSFNSPLGACPQCEGFGNVIGIDMDLVVPDRKKSLREGAIAPWNTPAYEHELQELLALAPDYDLPVDRPFGELDDRPPCAYSAWRAGAKIRRAGRFFQLSRAAEIQNARPRVPQPLAQLPPMRFVRRFAIAARGAGRPSGREEHRRDLGDENPRRRRVFPKSHRRTGFQPVE